MKITCVTFYIFIPALPLLEGLQAVPLSQHSPSSKKQKKIGAHLAPSFRMAIFHSPMFFCFLFNRLSWERGTAHSLRMLLVLL